MVQVIGVPVLLSLVQAAKKLMKSAGVKQDMITPIISVMLGAAYSYFAHAGVLESDMGLLESITGGAGLGAFSSVLFKVFNAARKFW